MTLKYVSVRLLHVMNQLWAILTLRTCFMGNHYFEIWISTLLRKATVVLFNCNIISWCDFCQAQISNSEGE
ncbi:hypothetical protein EUGRSUZ_F04364 [Eucalyptus grandis]|uniref:Uncharacterized protein n=2 Tax=Eucalyptus grandis TaxID=71139 RepID=A0ACC3KPL4_EUCGR|nr:hypothetical protein EUGRSUZ_F04364 [Eucalyptus grandis]